MAGSRNTGLIAVWTWLQGPSGHGAWMRHQLSESHGPGASAAWQVRVLHGLWTLLHLWRHQRLPGWLGLGLDVRTSRKWEEGRPERIFGVKGYHYSLLCKSEAICLQCAQFLSRHLSPCSRLILGRGESKGERQIQPVISFLNVLHRLEHTKRFTELGREEKGEGGDRATWWRKGESKD